MKKISTEKKLELIKRIREESNHNQSLITGRESILSDSGREAIGGGHFGFGKVRLFLSILLFLFCLWFRFSVGETSESMNYESLRHLLQEEINLNTIDFIGELPYNLTSADIE